MNGTPLGQTHKPLCMIGVLSMAHIDETSLGCDFVDLVNILIGHNEMPHVILNADGKRSGGVGNGVTGHFCRCNLCRKLTLEHCDDLIHGQAGAQDTGCTQIQAQIHGYAAVHLCAQKGGSHVGIACSGGKAQRHTIFNSAENRVRADFKQIAQMQMHIHKTGNHQQALTINNDIAAFRDDLISDLRYRVVDDNHNFDILDVVAWVNYLAMLQNSSAGCGEFPNYIVDYA